MVCCDHIAKSFGHVLPVRPTVRTYSAWRSRISSASAYFAIRVFRKRSKQIVLCVPPAWFDVGFAGGCAVGGSAGGGFSASAGETSVELHHSPMNPSVNG